jgi:hypothetical protein
MSVEKQVFKIQIKYYWEESETVCIKKKCFFDVFSGNLKGTDVAVKKKI